MAVDQPIKWCIRRLLSKDTGELKAGTYTFIHLLVGCIIFYP